MSNSVYKQILDTKYSVFDNPVILERFRLIVGSLVILFEPISADSLACLLQGTSSVSIISTLRQLRPVFTFGGSTSLIRTPHSSFHNFLTDEKSCPSPFFIDRQQQHAMLAERCFKVMTNLFNQTRALSEIYIRPGLVYGLCYWDSHLHTSSFDKAPFLLEQLRVFVKSQLKQWLCALFWSSALAHAILSVKNAHSWVCTNFPKETELATLLNDAMWCIPPYLDILMDQEEKDAERRGTATIWSEIDDVYLQLFSSKDSLRRHAICCLTGDNGFEVVHEILDPETQIEEALKILKSVVAHRIMGIEVANRRRIEEISNFLLLLPSGPPTYRTEFAETISQHSARLFPEVVFVDSNSHNSTAGSFGLLGKAYGAQYHWNKARDAMQEAVELYDRESERDERYLLEALRSLGGFEAKLENWVEAAEIMQRATTLGQQIITQMPKTYLAVLSRDLLDTGFYLSKIERWEEAVVVGQKGSKLYEELFDEAPDTHGEMLVLSLSNLCFYLHMLESWSEAIKANLRMVNIRRFMHTKLPDNHRQESLATDYSLLASNYSKEKRWTEAADAEYQSAKLFEELFDKSPDAWRDKFTASLSELSFRYEAAKMWSECVATDERVVALRREAFSEENDTSRISLADALNSLAFDLHQCGRDADGLPFVQESVDLLRASSSLNTPNTQSNLSFYLDTVAVCLHVLGSFDEAFTYSMEAVTIGRIYYPTHQVSSFTAEKWRDILETLRKILESLGRIDEAQELEVEIADV